MRYFPGETVGISVDAMINGDADMEYVDIMTDHDGDKTFYMLLNEFGELCCLDGEECEIDHIVNGTTDVYDLVNHSDGTVHFMLSEHDLDIAVFRDSDILLDLIHKVDTDRKAKEKRMKAYIVSESPSGKDDIDGIYHLIAENNALVWLLTPYGYTYDEEFGKVTHWAYLPEPPKEV